MAHIDFNLKRNSDFINELTKLLDTSRAIQQEKQLKKLLKSLEDERTLANTPTSLNVPNKIGGGGGGVVSQSQPTSPLNLRLNSNFVGGGGQQQPGGAAGGGGASSSPVLKPELQITDDQRKKQKSKSFKGKIRLIFIVKILIYK